MQYARWGSNVEDLTQIMQQLHCTVADSWWHCTACVCWRKFVYLATVGYISVFIAASNVDSPAHRHQSVYDIVDVQGNGKAQRVKLERLNGVEFSRREYSPPHQLQCLVSAVIYPSGSGIWIESNSLQHWWEAAKASPKCFNYLLLLQL